MTKTIKGERRGLTSSNQILALLLGIPLLVYVYLGIFSRYMSDDYCHAYRFKELGFIGSQIFWYKSWQGRYSFHFLNNILISIGPKLTSYLPAVLIVGWIAALFFFFHELLRGLEARVKRPVALLLSALVLLTTLYSTPNLWQVVYWQTGILAYSVPLVLSTAYAGWLLWVSNSSAYTALGRLEYICVAVGVLIICGFSETQVAVQVAALSIVSLIILMTPILHVKRRLVIHMVIGLVVSLAAMAVVLASPGNQIRSTYWPAPPGLLKVIELSVEYLQRFLRSLWDEHHRLIIFTAALAAWSGIVLNGEWKLENIKKRARIDLFLILLLPVFTLVLLLATIVPSAWAQSSYPEARVMHTASFITVSAIVCWFLFVGLLIQSYVLSLTRVSAIIWKATQVLVIIVVAAASFYASTRVLEIKEEVQVFANLWDQRDMQLRNLNRNDDYMVHTQSLPGMGGMHELWEDPNHWVNKCVAKYYHIQAVTTGVE